MYINYYETKDKYCSELSSFLDSDKDGVFYIGHASILVRLNNKKFIFDVIKNTNFYNRSWLFFPSQVNDKRIFDVDGVFVSHIHGDHYDPDLLKQIQRKNIPIYILDGRPGFNRDLKSKKINVIKIPVNKKFYIDKNIWVNGCLHEYNDIDSSLIISNDNLSVYHGNDNFITEKTLVPFKKEVGKVDVACIPFAFIHFYPYLLKSLEKKANRKEAKRLESQFMNYGIKQAKILKPDLIIPFGSNLFHLDNPKCPMNKGVSTPVDFVNYAKKFHHSLRNNYKTMLSGAYCLKEDKNLSCHFEKISSKKFNKSLENFTLKKIKLIDHKKIIRKIKIKKLDLRFIKNKISKNKIKINHKILVSNESQKDNKVCIDIKNNNVFLYNKDKLPLNSHYFIVQDNEFNQWIKKKITFEEVLGTRRFTYERYPNTYNVKVNSIYTNFL
tara:strand:+ start:216 stop:1535 length:1320 start_codon:yes stop_codon:yes gene_type:complete